MEKMTSKQIHFSDNNIYNYLLIKCSKYLDKNIN